MKHPELANPHKAHWWLWLGRDLGSDWRWVRGSFSVKTRPDIDHKDLCEYTTSH